MNAGCRTSLAEQNSSEAAEQSTPAGGSLASEDALREEASQQQPEREARCAGDEGPPQQARLCQDRLSVASDFGAASFPLPPNESSASGEAGGGEEAAAAFRDPPRSDAQSRAETGGDASFSSAVPPDRGDGGSSSASQEEERPSAYRLVLSERRRREKAETQQEAQQPPKPQLHKAASAAASNARGGGRGGGDFDCAICMDQVADPVVTRCGHLFCWPCLCDWLEYAKECPLCKAPVDAETVTPLYGRFASKEDHAHSRRSLPKRPKAAPPPPRTGRERDGRNAAASSSRGGFMGGFGGPSVSFSLFPPSVGLFFGGSASAGSPFFSPFAFPARSPSRQGGDPESLAQERLQRTLSEQLLLLGFLILIYVVATI